MVDFTPRSERLTPAEVVGILDHLFSHFDMLAERYAVEKIKTIGDCYMVAAGVPSPRPDHARALAFMALDMVEAMGSRTGSDTSVSKCGSGSIPAQWWQASSAASAFCTTYGAMP